MRPWESPEHLRTSYDHPNEACSFQGRKKGGGPVFGMRFATCKCVDITLITDDDDMSLQGGRGGGGSSRRQSVLYDASLLKFSVLRTSLCVEKYSPQHSCSVLCTCKCCYLKSFLLSLGFSSFERIHPTHSTQLIQSPIYVAQPASQPACLLAINTSNLANKLKFLFLSLSLFFPFFLIFLPYFFYSPCCIRFWLAFLSSSVQ